MNRINLSVIMTLGVTGMLYAGDHVQYSSLAKHYMQNVFPGMGFNIANIQMNFAALRHELRKEGKFTPEDYARALYQYALTQPAKGAAVRALAALWEILRDESLIDAVKKAGLFDQVDKFFHDMLSEYVREWLPK